MQTIPALGKLIEFTFEAETRPMISLDPIVLTRMQFIAEEAVGISDPVFSLDESTGAVGAVFQTWATTAFGAATRGQAIFLDLLRRVGLPHSPDVIEHIYSNILVDDEDLILAGGHNL